MRTYISTLLLLSRIFFLSGCARSKKDILVRNWHAIHLDNPQLEEMLAQQRLFIDTVGKSTDPAVNMALYGTNNVDSFKNALKAQLDSFVTMQQIALDNTWFNFKKNGTAILTFNGATDSSKWYFDDDGALILDEMATKGSGDKLKLQLVQLSDTVLKLRFTENNVNSVVTFHPEKN